MSRILTLVNGTTGDAAGVDKDDVQAKATSAFMSLHIVTVGAQSVANLVLEQIPPVETDDPDLQRQMKDVAEKVSDLQAKLDAAKVTANLWLPSPNGGLCTQLSSAIPHHLLDFGATYSAASGEILDLLKQAKTSGSSQALVGEALDLIGALLTQVKGYGTELTGAKAQLTDYTAKVQNDHNALVGGSDAIQTLIGIDKTDADNLGSDISRLHSEIDELHKKLTQAVVGTGLGVFVAIVGVAICFVPGGQVVGGVTIAVGVAGIVGGAVMWASLQGQIKSDENKIKSEQSTKDALTQQGIALTGLHTVVANLIGQVEAAQEALADLSVFWKTFELTLQSVVDDLSKPNADVSVIFDEMFVKAAQNNWDDLVEFAKNLLNVTVSVEFRPANAA